MPVGVVFEMPEKDVRLQLAFFDKEPPVLERIERIVAEHACLFANANRGKSSNPVQLISFLPHLKAWNPDEVSDTDFMIMNALRRG